MADEKDQQALDEVKNDNTSFFSPTRDWLARFFSFIAMVIAGYTCFLLYEDKLTTQEILLFSGELTRLDSSIEQKQLELRRDTDAAIKALSKKQADELDTIKRNLQTTLQKNPSASSTSETNWLIAEVEYLIRMASQRILMDRDPIGAMALLTAADQILESEEPLRSHSLRKSLASDILILKAVKQLDTEGIYLRLNAQIHLVQNLVRPVQEFKLQTEKKRSDAKDIDSVSGQELSFGQRVAALFSAYVDFRRQSDVIAPILPPTEEQYLRQNLVFNLRQAQMALLRQETEVFQASLSDALQWLDRFFQTEHPTTFAMLEALTELRELELDQNLPDISGSVQEVRNLSRTANKSLQ
ncbi:MAG: uroporphyrinogen-III C-methyltransferase [Candidatus Azotimanducaceae bacterium]|uniref:Uncharacterized protein n=1 Tax=OM182 bacterium TaxID=2510334 RepID=A0A520S5L5_9GAMM|nr:hypothetical protein [Gammaproteobacteria bacterium]OUV68414.1 MAG: hypothetical protein CBC93_01645 [Gammaproteobacteria bacterium TMED133]RZO77773.1 MAG: hypothetical protein EVA68_00670 [OM182 bacterium]